MIEEDCFVDRLLQVAKELKKSEYVKGKPHEKCSKSVY